MRETAVRWIERLEEGIYAVAFVMAAVFLVISAGRDALQELQARVIRRDRPHTCSRHRPRRPARSGSFGNQAANRPPLDASRAR